MQKQEKIELPSELQLAAIQVIGTRELRPNVIVTESDGVFTPRTIYVTLNRMEAKGYLSARTQYGVTLWSCTRYGTLAAQEYAAAIARIRKAL